MRYYLHDEVVLHNKKDDFWVVLHGNVLDLTPFLKDRYDHWNSVSIKQRRNILFWNKYFPTS